MASPIVQIRCVVARGALSPVTWSGRLLVDGVAVSSYAVHPGGMARAYEASPALQRHFEAVMHVVTLPFKLFNALFPGAAPARPAQTKVSPDERPLSPSRPRLPAKTAEGTPVGEAAVSVTAAFWLGGMGNALVDRVLGFMF